MKVQHPLSGVIWDVKDPTPYLSVGWTEVPADTPPEPTIEKTPDEVGQNLPAETHADSEQPEQPVAEQPKPAHTPLKESKR